MVALELIANSGLEDTLSVSFARVPKLMTGRNFPQNMKALQMVAKELLGNVFENDKLL